MTSAAVLLVAASLQGGAPAAVQVRANAGFAACLAPALEAFNRASALRAVLTVAEPDPPMDADLVVGDDSEMTRLLEGGSADLGSASDLGYLPWVTVAPAGSPTGGVWAAAQEPVAVLGGRAGREARASLSTLGPGRLRIWRSAAGFAGARFALVPRSLASPGERRPAAVRPLVATAAVIAGGPREGAARAVLQFLAGADGRRLLAGCLDPAPSLPAAKAASAGYALAVLDWWLPQCTLDRNRYNDPREVIGEPDAANLGGRDNYRGMMSLGQGGFVVLDMGASIADGPGDDVRVYQTTTGEPVTLYASTTAEGPFVLLGLRVPCGRRSSSGIFSNHCDFDLAAGGVAAARYLKVEDGEIYPCLAGGTLSEGADIDAVQALAGPN